MGRRNLIRVIVVAVLGVVVLAGCGESVDTVVVKPPTKIATNLPTMTNTNAPTDSISPQQITMAAWGTPTEHKNATLDANLTPTALFPTLTPTLYPKLGLIQASTVSHLRVIQKLEAHTNLITSLDFSPDGRLLTSGSQDNTVRIWEISTGREIKTLRLHRSNGIADVAFTPDGQLLIIKGYSTLDIYEVETWERIRSFNTGPSISSTRLAISPDSKYLVSDYQDWGIRTTIIKIWEIDTGKEIFSLPWPRWNPYLFITFSPDGKHLVTEYSKTLIFWDINNREKERTLYGRHYFGFSPDGRLLVARSYDNLYSFSLWEVPTYRRIGTLIYDREQILVDFAFSPDCLLLVAGGDDGKLTFWNINTMESIISLEGHLKSVQDIAVSPDGKRIASISWEEEPILIWGVPVGD